MSTGVVARQAGPSGPLPGVGVPAPRRPSDPCGPAALGPALGRALGPALGHARPPRRSWQDAARPRVLPSAADTGRPAAPARTRSTAVDHLLTLLALVGLAVTGLTVAATVSGLRPLVVLSGSMEPTIETGGMVLVRTVPAAEVRVGEVVAVDRPDGVRVTHRVLAAVPQGALVSLQLKGDANEQPDPEPVAVAEAGRVVWTVPLVGRLSSELTSARGGFVLGCLVTGGLCSTLRRSRRP